MQHLREEWVTYIEELGEVEACQRIVPDNAGNLYTFMYGRGKQWLAKFNAWGRLMWRKDIDDTIISMTHNGRGVHIVAAGMDEDGFMLWMETHADEDSIPVRRNVARIEEGTPNAAIVDEDGNVYVAGSTYDIDEESAWLAKFSPQKRQLWRVDFSIPDRVNHPRDIVLDGGGNVYVTGDSIINIEGDGSLDPMDAWIGKFDVETGKRLWLRPSGTEGPDAAYGLAVSDHGIYIAGIEDDVYIARYSFSGSQQWMQKLDGAKFSNVADIAADRYGNVYICGAELLGAHWAYVAKFQIKLETVSDLLTAIAPLMEEIEALRKQISTQRES